MIKIQLRYGVVLRRAAFGAIVCVLPAAPFTRGWCSLLRDDWAIAEYRKSVRILYD